MKTSHPTPLHSSHQTQNTILVAFSPAIGSSSISQGIVAMHKNVLLLLLFAICRTVLFKPNNESLARI